MSRSLLKNTSIFASNTFVSRVLGFVRDMVIAHFFGAASGTDAFFVAFRIPNFMRRLFAEGAFSQAFVPVLSDYRSRRMHEEVRTFIDHTATSLAAILFVVTVLGVLLAPIVVSIFAPGFLHNGGRFDLAAGMLKITFPYIFFISLTALSGAILNSYDSFGVPSITPIFLNISLILMAFFASSYFASPVYALAWGVFIAGIVQFTFQLPFLLQKKLLPRIRFNFSDPGVRRVVKLMVPAIAGVSVVQIGILIDTIFASFLRTGSVSWLYYSDRLMNFPLGVFGVAIATVILPKLSRQHSAKKHSDYSKTLDWGIRVILLIGIPASIGIFILAGPLLSTLFQGGKFTSFDVVMAQKSLMAFAIGIQAYMLIKVFASGFYARQDIKTPVKIAIIAVIINIALNASFIIPLRHAGLALATSLAAMVNASLLLRGLLKRKIFKPQAGWIKYLSQITVANLIMATFLIIFTKKITVWVNAAIFWKLANLGFLVLGASFIYLAFLFICGLKISDFS